MALVLEPPLNDIHCGGLHTVSTLQLSKGVIGTRTTLENDNHCGSHHTMSTLQPQQTACTLHQRITLCLQV